METPRHVLMTPGFHGFRARKERREKLFSNSALTREQRLMKANGAVRGKRRYGAVRVMTVYVKFLEILSGSVGMCAPLCGRRGVGSAQGRTPRACVRGGTCTWLGVRWRSVITPRHASGGGCSLSISGCILTQCKRHRFLGASTACVTSSVASWRPSASIFCAAGVPEAGRPCFIISLAVSTWHCTGPRLNPLGHTR